MKTIEQKIIKILSDFPEKDFYGQEIANKIKCSKASASLILRSLAKKKIVRQSIKGNMKFYQINSENPEVKKIRINETMEVIEPFVAKLKKNAKKIILFGSSCRGEQTVDSDIDLFILSDSKNLVYEVLNKIPSRVNLKTIVKTVNEWSEMEVSDTEFYHEIKNGIVLYEYVPRV